MIKMRVNKKKESKCNECNIEWKNTPEMYDLNICGNTFVLCQKCVDMLFHKTLKASVIYNERVKTKEDMMRISNNRSLNPCKSDALSVSEALKGVKGE